MSRDQSINRIAPHVYEPYLAGSSRAARVAPFSPYRQQKVHERAAGDHPKREQADAPSPQDSSAPGAATDEPEIFTLIAGPDFGELFALWAHHPDPESFFTVKELRRDRGITGLVPVAEGLKHSPRQVQTYQSAQTYFKACDEDHFDGVM